MKKILLLLFAFCIVFTNCEKKEKEFDWTKMLAIRPAAGVPIKSDDGHLTAYEIVSQSWDMRYFNNDYSDGYIYRGITIQQRKVDPIDPRIEMYATDVIQPDGSLYTEFLKAYDVVFTRNHGDLTNQILDTIAYIPNSTIKKAYEDIKASYDAQDYDKVYKLFDEAYKFVPITGTEWRKLKAKGLE